MISVEKLHSYLNKNPIDETNEERPFIFRIPEVKMADGHIYGKYVLDGKFSFLKKEILPVPTWTGLDDNYRQLVDKTAIRKNSFVIGILNQIMPEFRYFDYESRISFTRDLMRQIAYDMEEKNLYREMEYTRIRNEIRSKMINFQDIDNCEAMKKIVVDYFSLTVYIIRRDPVEKFGKERLIEKISFVPGVWKKTERSAEYSLKNPTCFLIESDGKYSSVIRKEMNGLFSWQDTEMIDILSEFAEESMKKSEKKVKTDVKKKSPKIEAKQVEDLVENTDTSVEQIDESLETKSDEKQKFDEEQKLNETEETTDVSVETTQVKIHIPKKITLGEIQKIAEKEGISLTKKSDKTGKDLKKSIQELREEILKKYE